MTHDLWTDRLSEYVDRELPGAERSALEAHLATCESCQDTVAVLRAVQQRAARLADRAPRQDLWPAIAALIGGEAPVTSESTAVRPISRRRRYLFSIPQLAAAGIALATIAGGSVWLALGSGAAIEQQAITPAPSRPAPEATLVSNASMRAEQTYDAAVADLQAMLDAGRSRLDPRTVRVLERNLAAIDSAVADAQRALAADPANTYLNIYLARTMRRKLDLLRHAATLASARS